MDGKIEALIDHPLLQVMEVKRRIEDPLGFTWSKDNVTEISPAVGFVDTVIGNNNLIVHQLLEQKATRAAPCENPNSARLRRSSARILSSTGPMYGASSKRR